MSYFPSFKVTQDVIADSNNTSSTNLTAEQMFTGQGTSTIGVNAIQITLKTDQNCVIYVDQGPDTDNWDIVDTYEYKHQLNGVSVGTGFTVQAVGAYVRVRVLNEGTATTSYFRLNTVLCPIVEAVPRSLDESGNLKVGLRSIEDSYGFEVENTPTDAMRVSNINRLVGAQFSGNTVDPNFWTVTQSAGASATQGGAELILNTNASLSGGSVFVQSVRTARYVGGAANYFRAVIQADNLVTDNIRRFGSFTTTDGAFFELNNTTFRLVTRKNSVDIPVSNGSFNGNLGNTFTIGTNVRTYEIYWTNSKVWFGVQSELLHTVSTTLSTWSSTMNLPIRFENTNSATKKDSVQLQARVATINRLGPLTTETIYKNITTATTTICKYGPGRITRLLLNSPSQQAGIVTIYDNITNAGTIIGTLQWTANNAELPQSILFDVPFSTGLTIVTSQATNITVIYE
jgi:hypothetical protein